jgi:hypothetical protein
MRTQLDDLKKDLEYYEGMLKVFDFNGMTKETSEAYREYENKRQEIISTIKKINTNGNTN